MEVQERGRWRDGRRSGAARDPGGRFSGAVRAGALGQAPAMRRARRSRAPCPSSFCRSGRLVGRGRGRASGDRRSRLPLVIGLGAAPSAGRHTIGSRGSRTRGPMLLRPWRRTRGRRGRAAWGAMRCVYLGAGRFVCLGPVRISLKVLEYWCSPTVVLLQYHSMTTVPPHYNHSTTVVMP